MSYRGEVFAPVPRSLQPYVAARMPYDVDLGAPGIHRGLPDTTLTLVFPLDTPLGVSWAGEPDTHHRSWSCLSGLHTAPASIHHDGHQRGIQLALTLAGARMLLGRPAGDLAGVLTDLDRVVPELRTLPEQLHAQPTWPARVALVDRVLADLLARAAPTTARSEVGHALARLAHGCRVAEVADEVGYSRRRLGTLVRTESGLSPKAFQRVARFQASQRRLRQDPAASLAVVAADCGFSDQAHLTRDWRALAGCAPSTWLREELPFVQPREGNPRPVGDHQPA